MSVERETEKESEVEKETIDQAKLCCLSILASLLKVEWHKIGGQYLLDCVCVFVCTRARKCVQWQGMDMIFYAYLHTGESHADGLLDRNTL